MADDTRRRTGELLQKVFEVLWEKPEGLPAKEVLDQIPSKIKLTDPAIQEFSSRDNGAHDGDIIRTGDGIAAALRPKRSGDIRFR